MLQSVSQEANNSYCHISKVNSLEALRNIQKYVSNGTMTSNGIELTHKEHHIAHCEERTVRPARRAINSGRRGYDNRRTLACPFGRSLVDDTI
jgi:hypothetical protein